MSPDVLGHAVESLTIYDDVYCVIVESPGMLAEVWSTHRTKEDANLEVSWLNTRTGLCRCHVRELPTSAWK